MNREETSDVREGEQVPPGELEDELLAMAARTRATVEELVREQPHAALGVAAAVGFVLGGGLTPRRLLRLGLALGGPTLTRTLAAQAADLLVDSLSRQEEPERRV